MTVAAVVTAAGLGTRLGTDLPKALVRVEGRTLVAWAVERIAEVCRDVVVTAPPAQLDAFGRAIAEAAISPDVAVAVIAGGETRQESVAAGVAELMSHSPRPTIILVHDAARAFMPAEPMRVAIGAIEAGADGAVPIVPLVDTIVAVPGADGSLGLSVNRSLLRAAQTPQAFRASALSDAHLRGAAEPGVTEPGVTEPAVTEPGAEVTDDAGLVRRYGYRVVATEGHPWGFKVTVPGDLALADYIAKQARGAAS
ncbi:MAG TPA: IspD/TarI family cytidylyltransferase [Demequinaceae bacterium]